MKIRISKSFVSVRIGTEYHHIHIKLGRNGYIGLRWGLGWWAVN